MNATTVAIDLAKEIFEVAVANRAGRVIDRKRLTRRQCERFIDSLEVGTEVVMETCGTAHGARRLQQVPGVGVLTATTLVGAVSHIHGFRRGRDFASGLGLTPRESSTGSRHYVRPPFSDWPSVRGCP